MNRTILRAQELNPELIKNRRYLHEHPELGFELPLTTQFVEEELSKSDIPFQRVGKAGISALIGNPGKTFLIRGDMDALPMAENTDLSFRSRNGWMHACGHDIHTSSLLGAARILKERENELKGTVKLMFQPCEEGMGGAQDMVAGGILENPGVDAALALHVVHKESGTVGCTIGDACASSDAFRIVITGQGAHGAAAYLGVDPINVAAHLHLALQELNSREIHPDKMVVLTIGMIAGGNAPNIIPQTVEMRGTLRTRENEVRSFVKQRMVEIATSVAKTFRAECQIDFEGDGAPPMVNEPALSRDFMRYIDEMLGKGTSYEIPKMTGSEDFSVVSQLVPSVLLWVGTGSEKEGYPFGVHHPEVTFNESVIHKFSAIYAECAIRWLEEHQDQDRRN